MIEWKHSDIKDSLVGMDIGGIRVLNRNKAGNYYGIDFESKKLYELNDDGSIAKRVLKLTYGNPYIHLNNGITIIYTAKLQEILIDTVDYTKIDDMNFYVAFDIVCTGKGKNQKSASEIIHGRKIKGLDLRRLTFEIKTTDKKEKDRQAEIDRLIIIIKEYITRLGIDKNKQPSRIRQIDGVIKERGHEGEIVNNMQILNHIGGNRYLARLDDSRYRFAIVEYRNVLSIIRYKTVLYKNETAYIKLNDGSTILIDHNGLEIKIDTKHLELVKKHYVRYNKSIGAVVYGNKYRLDKDLKGIKQNRKYVYWRRNGDILDLMEDNIVAFNLSTVSSTIAKYLIDNKATKAFAEALRIRYNLELDKIKEYIINEIEMR